MGVAESVVCRTVQRTENLLIKSPALHLPGKKKLREEGTPFAVIMVDVGESPVERPQNNSGHTTAGKKAPYSEVLIRRRAPEPRDHRRRRRQGTRARFETIQAEQKSHQGKDSGLADRGDQGLQKRHRHSQTPPKQPRGGALPPQEQR